MLEFLDAYTNQIAFIIAALLGGFAHYLKKFLRKETLVSFVDWFGKDNLPATLYTFIIFSFAIIGSLAFDIITAQTGFWAVLYTGFVTGFAIDSGFNSDSSLNDQLVANKESLQRLGIPGTVGHAAKKDEPTA